MDFTGCHHIVRALLVHGAQAERVDEDGNTALHRAAAGGHPATFSVLCTHNSKLLLILNKRQEKAMDLVLPIERRGEFHPDAAM